MNITKDEARILAEALKESKHELIIAGDEALEQLKALEDLEQRLQYEGMDNRRIGRTSMNSWRDLLRRYTSKLNNPS